MCVPRKLKIEELLLARTHPVLEHRSFSEHSPSSSESACSNKTLGLLLPTSPMQRSGDSTTICQGKQHNRIVAVYDLLLTCLCWRRDEVDQCKKYRTATARKYIESRKRFALIFL